MNGINTIQYKKRTNERVITKQDVEVYRRLLEEGKNTEEMKKIFSAGSGVLNRIRDKSQSMIERGIG
jgi:hypothetical protein